MMSDCPTIVLFNAPKEIGGTPILTIRMARELKRLGVPFLVIDLHAGFVTKRLLEMNIPCIIPNGLGTPNKIDNLLPKNAVIVAFNADTRHIAEILKRRDVHLLVWDVYPPYWLDGFLNIDIPFLRLFINRSRWASDTRKRIATIMMNRNGVVMMDESSLENMEVLTGAKWSPATLMPVPVEYASRPRIPRSSKGGVTSCFYIGRSDLWKVVPCKRLIQDFGPRDKAHWTIITDSATRFREYLGIELPDSITFVEGVRGADLDRMLLAHADICFGMGTSCLEGAKLGVPSILLDFVISKDEMPQQYRYRWLYEELGYCLGRNVSGFNEVAGKTAKQVLSEFQINADQVGQLCWNAIREKFAIDTVARKLLLAAQKSRLMLSDYTDNNLFRLARMGYLWRKFRTAGFAVQLPKQ